MSLTRADVEAMLVDRAAAMLALVGKDSTTVDGANASLNYPIAKAIKACGFGVTTVSAVEDADVARVPEAQENRLLDYAELYTLESVLGNWTGVDEKFGQDEQKLDQIRKGLESRIKLLEDRVRKPYGTNLGASMSASLSGGSPKNDPDALRRGGSRTTISPWSIP